MKNNLSTNGLAATLIVMALLLAACQGQNAEPGTTTDLPDDSLIIEHAAAQSKPDTIGPVPEPLLAFLKPPKPLASQGDTLEYAVSHTADSLLRIPADHPHAIAAWNRMAQQVDSIAKAPYSAADFVPTQLAKLYERAPQQVLQWIYDNRRSPGNKLAVLLPNIETLTIDKMKSDVDQLDDSLARVALYAILPINIHLNINATENGIDFYRREMRRIQQTDGVEALNQFNTLVVKWNMDESINLLTCTLYDDFCTLARRLYLRSPQDYLRWIYNHRNTLEFAQRDHLSEMLLAAAQSTRRLSLRHIHQAIDNLEAPADAREYLHLRF